MATTIAGKSMLTFKVLIFLSWLGFIPTTKLRLKIFGSLQCFQFLIGVTAIIFSHLIFNNDSTTDEMVYIVTDITFYLNGIMCFFANYQLGQRNPDMIKRKFQQKIISPSRVYLLILISVLCFITPVSFIVYASKQFWVENGDNWQFKLSVNIINLLNCAFSQLSICSHLYLFGTIVSNYGQKKYDEENTVKENVSDRENGNNLVEHFEEVLENYRLFQKTVSLGLLMIFSLQTVSSIAIIYVTIQSYKGEKLFSFFINVHWSIVVCLILAYLALVAEDVDQSRLEVIDYLW